MNETPNHTSAECLIEALRDPACYDHPDRAVQVLETHISWVLLTGRFAYKFKKPVVLPFVDFSTLARREHFCREELRLNRRRPP
jgi:aminoglycoside phosphotransferase family enzyme